jgi:hypothetical protein
MPTYTYNNGNFSSTTNIVNGIAYTQNVMMLNSTSNGCGDSPCPQGYSLYFPCLKNITRGEDACFEFYVVNNAIKDVVDLRDVDALSITLTGNFGCTLGTYTYPSDNNYIRPLQTQDYKSVLDEGFLERKKCNLTVISVNKNLDEISEYNIDGAVGRYFEGDTVSLEAFDTESYIFVGWVDIDSDLDDECDDYFFSTDRSISFEINSDKNLAAVYRNRRTFKITTVETNSFYSYYKDGDELPLHNGHIVKEGEYIIVRSIPVNCIFSNWKEEGIGESWHTNKGNIVMQIEVSSDITLNIDNLNVEEDAIFGSDWSGDEIDYFDLNFIGFSFDNLISIYNIKTNKGFIEEHKLTQNVLSEDLVYFDGMNVLDVFISCTPIDYDNISCYGVGDNTMLKIGDKNNNGYIKFSNPGVKDETVVEIYCMKHSECDTCSISVSLDNETQIEEVEESDITRLMFRFDKSDFETITISTIGEIFPEEKSGYCFIDKIVVSDMVVVDKGKAALCLPGSVTKTFHRGKITATGAIMIGGSSYGLPCTSIGTITNNPVINTMIL